MKVLLLTTDTPHHQYYARQLLKDGLLSSIVLEFRGLKKRFATHHSYEDQQKQYEVEFLLENQPLNWSTCNNVFHVNSINDVSSISLIESLRPDVIVVFGTSKLSQSIIKVPKLACLNLHGGNPEEYRGLDSHLWAIYHNDFQQLVTTLHYVNETLDDGEIVFSSKLPIAPRCQLYQLRAINTKICVQLTCLALHSLQTSSWLPSRLQVRKGRYYSSMPSDLKTDCMQKFDKYTRKL